MVLGVTHLKGTFQEKKMMKAGADWMERKFPGGIKEDFGVPQRAEEKIYALPFTERFP